MTEGILGVVLALAILMVGGLRQDRRTGGPRSLAVSTSVLDSDHHLMGVAAGVRWSQRLVMDVADDEPAVAVAQLSAVVFADADPLLEAEGRLQERDRCSHIRIDEDRDDNTSGNRPVGLHPGEYAPA